ncbi:MAG: protein rep [Pseudonocardia sp.]|nr:protein rep [Pseudonocardia sp.]
MEFWEAEREEQARKDRRLRHKLLDWLRSYTTLGRVAKCCGVPKQAGGLKLRLGANGRAYYEGLATCGSPWSCPVHAASIGERRAREEIAPCVRHTIDEGGSVLHLVFTTSHHAGMDLSEVFDAVTSGWSFVGQHRAWRRLDEDYGRMGFCRGAEATWGVENGWHPHLHVLLFLAQEVTTDEAVGIGDRLYEVYRSGLAKKGFTLNRENGVRVEVATTRRDAEGVLSRYVTKIASEVTRHDKKSGRKAHRLAPFEMLRQAHDAQVLGDADTAARLLALWAEWEQTTYGRKQLTWSGKWRGGPSIREMAGVGVEEASDDELAEKGNPDSWVELLIPTGPDHEGNWAKLRPQRTQLLDVLECHGQDAALRWCTQRGITAELPRTDLPEGWAGPDDMTTQEILRRDAHRVLTTPREQLPTPRRSDDQDEGLPEHAVIHAPARAVLPDEQRRRGFATLGDEDDRAARRAARAQAPTEPPHPAHLVRLQRLAWWSTHRDEDWTALPE